MNEKRLLFRYSPYWGRCETPYFHCLAVFDVWFWRQKSSNEKRKKCQDSRNSHTPTVYNAYSQISGHFCHYFYPIFASISVNSQPIFTWFCRQHQLISRQLPCKYDEVWWSTSKVINEINVKFAWVFSKVIHQFRRQFFTVYHVISQAPSAGITATTL